MKQFFFLFAIFGIVFSVAGYFLWKLLSAVYGQWSDSRVVKSTRLAAAELRQKRAKLNAQRLENGCEHRFGETLGGFPPFACRGCGLERQKPAGPCDHVWRINTDGHPGAVCEQCGKPYRPPVSV